MRRITMVPVVLAAVSLAATGLAAPATASTPDPYVVLDQLVSPLSLGVGDGGEVFVSQNFASTLTEFGAVLPTAVYNSEAGDEVGAVSVTTRPARGASPQYQVTFATTAQTGDSGAKLWSLVGDSMTQLADLGAYEASENPDADLHYGVLRLNKDCKAAIPKKLRPTMIAHTGGLEAHPYASYVDGDTTYVADAGANAILSVDSDGVHTVAVLPPVRVKLGAERRADLKLPRCTQGKFFQGEAVPTDVEMAPDGDLYVSTLGGELGESDAVGAIYRVNPDTGKVTEVDSGLMSPVGLAFQPDGTMFVSLLFANKIMRQPVGGDLSVFAKVPYPGDIEIQSNLLYATETDVTNDGTQPPAGQVDSWTVSCGRTARCRPAASYGAASR